MSESDDAEFVRLIRAVPPGDTIGVNELRATYEENCGKGVNRADLLADARRRTGVKLALGNDHAPRTQALRARTRDASERALLGRNKAIAKKLQPAIEDFREIVFGRRRPPFTSLADAAAWIESHSDNDRLAEAAETERQRLLRELDPITSRLWEIDPWNDYQPIVEGQPHYVGYWSDDGSPRSRRVSRDHQQLFAMRGWAVNLSAQTEIPSRSLLALLLVGLIPGGLVELKDGRRVVMPGVDVVVLKKRLPAAEGRHGVPRVRSERIVLDFDIRDFTDRNLRVARQRAVAHLQLKPTRDVTKRQQRIATIVQTLGGPPKVKFDPIFWNTAMKKLNEGTKTAKLSSRVAVAKLYYRSVSGS